MLSWLYITTLARNWKLREKELMEVSLHFRVVSSLVLLGLVGFFLYLYNAVWLKSERVRRMLRTQGIKGPTPSLLYGNLPEMQKIQLQALKSPNHAEFVAHDYTSSVFPYFEHWRKEYGNSLTSFQSSIYLLLHYDTELDITYNVGFTLLQILCF